jgi:hypothetical protein
MVGLGVSSIFWVFSSVLPLFSVFLLFWCPSILLVCLGALLRFFNDISFLTYQKNGKGMWILTSRRESTYPAKDTWEEIHIPLGIWIPST